MLSLIVSLLGLSPSTNLYLSKATAHCANATLEPCSYTLYINHDTDNPGVLPVLRYFARNKTTPTACKGAVLGALIIYPTLSSTRATSTNLALT